MKLLILHHSVYEFAVNIKGHNLQRVVRNAMRPTRRSTDWIQRERNTKPRNKRKNQCLRTIVHTFNNVRKRFNQKSFGQRGISEKHNARKTTQINNFQDAPAKMKTITISSNNVPIEQGNPRAPIITTEEILRTHSENINFINPV